RRSRSSAGRLMTVMLVCGLKQGKKNLYTLNRKNGVLTMGSTTYSIAPSCRRLTAWFELPIDEQYSP
ncbi:MAG: hypothetical protein ACYDG7_02975, partial [Thermoleophilia bacterium]